MLSYIEGISGYFLENMTKNEYVSYFKVVSRPQNDQAKVKQSNMQAIHHKPNYIKASFSFHN